MDLLSKCLELSYVLGLGFICLFCSKNLQNMSLKVYADKLQKCQIMVKNIYSKKHCIFVIRKIKYTFTTKIRRPQAYK